MIWGQFPCFASSSLAHAGTFIFSQTQSISLIILGTITFTSIVFKIFSCLQTSDISSRNGVVQILENYLCNIMKLKKREIDQTHLTQVLEFLNLNLFKDNIL